MAKKRFEYKARDFEDWKKRAETRSGNFDSYLRDDIEVFSPKEENYQLRILPNRWDGGHYGYSAWVHYGIGPDESSYLCLEKMGKGTCPICEERRAAHMRDDKEYASELSPRERICVWVIDRDDEKAGPKLWAMPPTVDQDFAQQACNPRTKEVYAIDDPNEEGYDVEFTRKGTGLRTKYVGVTVSRHESPLSEDYELAEDWLYYVEENPPPDCMVYYDEEYITKVFKGHGRTKPDDEEVEPRSSRRSEEREDNDDDDDNRERATRRSRREDNDEDERPRRRALRSRRNEDKEPEEENREEEKPEEEDDRRARRRARSNGHSRREEDSEERPADDNDRRSERRQRLREMRERRG